MRFYSNGNQFRFRLFSSSKYTTVHCKIIRLCGQHPSHTVRLRLRHSEMSNDVETKRENEKIQS